MTDSTTPGSSLPLARDASGRLVFTDAAGQVHAGVAPVRAFPIAAPDEGISLVNTEGHEVAWVDSLRAMAPATRLPTPWS